MSNELVVKKLNEVIVLEEKLQKIKEIEKEIKNQKEELKQLMIETNMKKWETPNGTKITLVEDAEDEEIEVETVDYAKFNTEHLELFLKKEALEKEIKEAQKPYTTITKEIKKGKKGYVLITLPKNKEGNK
jgi:hypothetical protein